MAFKSLFFMLESTVIRSEQRTAHQNKDYTIPPHMLQLSQTPPLFDHHSGKKFSELSVSCHKNADLLKHHTNITV